MTAAAFASWVQSVLVLDTWYTEGQAALRFARAGARVEAAVILASLRRAGWVEEHPQIPGDFCLPSRCWLPNPNPQQQKSPASRS